MSNETKFFDVERAKDSAYDLKELRRLFKRILRKSNVEYDVFKLGRGVHGVIRLKVVVPRYMTMNFVALQQEYLDDRGLMLRAVAGDGSSEPIVPMMSSVLEEERAVTSPTAILVSVVETGSHKPIPLHPQLVAADIPAKAVRSAA